MQLYWNQQKFKLEVPLSKTVNIVAFNLAPEFNQYSSYCHELQITDEIDDMGMLQISKTQLEDEELHVLEKLLNNRSICEHTNITSFSSKVKIATPISSDYILTSNEAELLQYHRNFGHIPFPKLQSMAKQAIIPPKLAKCKIPTCATYIGGIMGKRNWQNKQHLNRDETILLKPGNRVSVDMLVSPTPGLVAQMTSILTRKYYKYATAYVDNASRFGYAYLQVYSIVETTLKGKNAFEQYAASQGIQIKAYHADNGIFKAKGLIEHCAENRQAMAFARVNAHHQNGLVERRIHQLQDQSRLMLIFASSRWPKCMHIAL